MSQEIDYATELKKYLYENLKKKNESIEKFEQRIEGCYFSEKVLDYDLLPKIINDPDAEAAVMFEWVFGANYWFLCFFKEEAKARLNNIQKKVKQITKDSNNQHYYKNGLLLNLLAIVYGENYLKYKARLINTEVSPAIKKAIKKDLGSLVDALDVMQKLFCRNQDSPDQIFSQEYYEEIISHPIRDRAVKYGFTEEKLSEFKEFIQEHKSKELAALTDAELTSTYAKRDRDYAPLSREHMKILFKFLTEEIAIPANKARIYMAEVFNLFEIRRIQDIIDEADAKTEKLSDEDALKELAKRIGDVIKKQR